MLTTPPGTLSLLYRGTLASCNYACGYCPFAKKRDSRATLARDAREVARFTSWLAAQKRDIGILFTPWGEALVRRHYRAAMQTLASLPHVRQVALQTNLSGPLNWLQGMDGLEKIGLWCTYHPDQTTLARFLERCARLDTMGVRYSVGVVAMNEHLDAIRALRAALPKHVYLWLNAYDRRGPHYYSEEDLAWFDAVDPWFAHNRRPSSSRGKPCLAGETSLSVDGDGELARCHFVPERLGNLYEDDLADMLQEKSCPRFKCDCYIGYAQRKDLPFQAVFGEGVLARISPLNAGVRPDGSDPGTATT
ncbi:STM4011 family radical SAM protein [Janthinobacterium sp. PLB04]|uniref:Radical SAM/SPASM domain-containing protein n=1 Tax=Janthinobacterium lividum TaxID=29581 RepID=A0AAJ4MNA1_9BURK|nr:MULTISPECIES: STM4011 family radical SAM protein [Janthinobacterium]KAB0324946.1 radical SAM/SPASM domain-containing protein [Janthinobacterium lividum]QSX94036.1 radical SAM/SPASM domain-containing protein [Janthinobacterium lividum]UGQ33796.1 STM4011 family radical SAM protein [Janthinobacterium sp. PLB04]